ncbi:reverse transcriptase family protein [Aliidiomarina indica]|uniref:reverse transcriptase family protein n=1 Tax=Aliidiomarina indica TaxID=2749147 RepID=UPI00188E8BC7|nr:reverse transcriptase family protein [Aliidiomarina indica]
MTYRMYFERKVSGPIDSRAKLCQALSIGDEELTQALALTEAERYTESSVPKADGTTRTIYNPHHKIRKLQRRINTRFFNPSKKIHGNDSGIIRWPSYIFGCVPNDIGDDGETEVQKDYVACARVHCPSKSILKMDISDFYNNVHRDLVLEVFKDMLGFTDDEVASLLTDICCKGDSLVQGGLTSSYLACLALYDEEPEVVRRLKRKGFRYTRLIDDITISSPNENVNFDYVKDLVVNMLHAKELPVNRDKTKVQYVSTEPLLVHGLRVNFKEPRLPKGEAARIRANVHNVERLAKERHYRTIHPYRRDFNKCMGRVNKLARVNPPLAG